MCSDLSSDAKNLLLAAKISFGSTEGALGCQTLIHRPLASNVSPLNVHARYGRGRFRGERSSCARKSRTNPHPNDLIAQTALSL
jgi:hypothetical protein